MGKVYSSVLERRVWLQVEPWIQEEQSGFRSGSRTLNQLYTLVTVLEGAWEFAQPVPMCFVDLEKAYDSGPQGVLGGDAPEVWSRGPLLRATPCL